MINGATNNIRQAWTNSLDGRLFLLLVLLFLPIRVSTLEQTQAITTPDHLLQ